MKSIYPDTGTSSGSVVVVIHDNMDPEVDGDWDPLLQNEYEVRKC